ncbi:MAG: hypothetical protein CVV27_12610 [Candidatus Melainabacteria bacterium HGW-Melainabacteria-1]|nr:MAG: hypothetical protein CVV27_12610 [Candidatus Melainabacteria bacterium HGW-Melainabacteria-1]
MSHLLQSQQLQVALDDTGDFLAFIQLQPNSGPVLRLICERFYADYVLSRIQIEALRVELEKVLGEYAAALSQELLIRKQIRARSKLVQNEILAGLLKQDLWVQKLESLIALCDDALAGDGTLRGFGD